MSSASSGNKPIWRRPALAFSLIAAVAVVAVLLAQAARPAAAPAPPGSAFPALAGLKSLQAGGTFGSMDVGPPTNGNFLVLFYWVAGHPISENGLVAIRDWAGEHDNVTLVSVVPPRGTAAAEVSERAAALGLDTPIVWDEGYRVQATVQAGSVPHITLVDPTGVVRVTGAASLRHEVSAGTTFADYLERALGGKGHPTIEALPRYYPVIELIDEPSPDFVLSEVPSSRPLRFSDHITDGKLTLLVFWSPDCGHCKKELPAINAYYKTHREDLNIVGIVRTKDAGFRQRTTDFIRLHELEFPVVTDDTSQTWDDFKVVTTPTTVVVAPGGLVDSVLLGSEVNLAEELSKSKTRLSKSTVPGV